MNDKEEGDKEFDRIMLSSEEKSSHKGRLRASTVEFPTKLVHEICNQMKGVKRGIVIDECVKRGVAYGTARQQYQLWFKRNKETL